MLTAQRTKEVSPIGSILNCYKTESTVYRKFGLSTHLNDIVEYCWIIQCKNRQTQVLPDIHIPDGLMEVIFVFEGSYSKVSISDTSGAKLISSSCVIGIQTDSNLVNGIGKHRMLGIKFTALGFSLLFGQQMSVLINENVSFKDVRVHWLLEVQDNLASQSNVQNIAQLLSDTIIKQVRSTSSHHAGHVVWSCVKIISDHKGIISVEQLSTIVNKSVRQLQRYFATYVGITPKQYINIIRFKNLYRESVLMNVLPTSYLDYGYYDQSHFIKDFRRRAGIPPSQATSEGFLKKNKIASINLG